MNLTMTHVNCHEEMLYKLDTQLFLINKTIQELLVSISYLQYEADLLEQMQNRLNCIYSSMHSLCSDTEALSEFMRVNGPISYKIHVSVLVVPQLET